RLRGLGDVDQGDPSQALLGRPPGRDREGAPGRLQHPPPGPGRGSPDGQLRPCHRFQEYGHHHDVEPGGEGHHEGPHARLPSAGLGPELRGDAAEGQVRDRAGVQPGVPEPAGRHHRLPSVDEGADRPDRSYPPRGGPEPARGGAVEAQADGCGDPVPRRPRLRRELRCSSAPPGDPASPRGSALGEDPDGRVRERRRDRGGRGSGGRGARVPGPIVQQDMTDRSGASGVMVRERTWAAAAAALVVCAVLFPVRAARGQDPAGAAAGPPRVVIDGVQVRGAIRLDPSVIAAESGLRAGDTITYRDVNRAIRRLWATGRYEDVQASVAASGEACERATITLDVVERAYVALIDFAGLEQTSAGTIRDTVGPRPGAPLAPAKVAEAKAMVRDLLASKGFQLRSIDHRLEELDSRPGE